MWPRLGQGEEILRTLWLLPGLPGEREGEAEVQAARTAQAGAGETSLWGQEAGTGMATNRGQGGWDRLGPPRSYLEFEPRGRTRQRTSENSGCRKKPLATV